MDAREQQAFDLVGTKEERILDLYKTLIGVDTTVPPGKNYDTLIDLIEPEFQRLGFTTERVTIPDDLVATIPLPLEGPLPLHERPARASDRDWSIYCRYTHGHETMRSIALEHGISGERVRQIVDAVGNEAASAD